MKYDEVISSNSVYGIMKGNDVVVYIKVGNGGSIDGWNNKYLIISNKIKKLFGYTVIVSSNPVELKEKENIYNDMSFIEKYMDNNIKKIYGIGHSNGGVILLNYAYLFPKIENILSINAPLNINWHKVKEGILLSKAKLIRAVYGTLDPSYRYIELLKTINNKNLKIIEINDMDHNFSQNFDLFCDLSFKYLFNEEV